MRLNQGWLRAGQDMWTMTFDAMAVIGMRTAKIAQGGREAEVETIRMIEEKIYAGMALHVTALTGLWDTPESLLAKSIQICRPKVEANRRRLSRGK